MASAVNGKWAPPEMSSPSRRKGITKLGNGRSACQKVDDHRRKIESNISTIQANMKKTYSEYSKSYYILLDLSQVA